MKFYMTPGSCSTGIHILLEELELLFEVYLVDLLAGDHQQQGYLAINPKATIPTLVLDNGESLTDFLSIAWWLGQNYPKAKLLTEDHWQQVKMLEIMSFVIGTIHMQGFARIFTTEKFSSLEQEHGWVKQQGEKIVEDGFNYINQTLHPSGFIGPSFSIADPALFYVEFWAKRLAMTLPPNCESHYLKMLERPAVRRVLQEEGYRL